MTVDPEQLNDLLYHYGNDLLTWVGFGTLAGLLAKAIMPGRDPGGAVATLAMGIGGSVIGCSVLMYFWEGHRVSPLTLEGFAVATGGAFVLLAFYRLFRRDKVLEGERPGLAPYFTTRRTRRRRERVYED